MKKLGLTVCAICLMSAAPLLSQNDAKDVSNSLTAPPLPAAAQEAEYKGLMAAKQQEFGLAVRYFGEARKSAPYSAEILFNLGLAESKLPGRELRAIAWFKAYLAASPAAANAPQVHEQIAALEIKAEANMGRVIEVAHKVASQFTDDWKKQSAFGRVAIAHVQVGDIVGARQLATSLTADELSDLATAEAGVGEIDAAREIASLIPKDSLGGLDRSSTYASIATKMAQGGDISGALSILDGSTPFPAKFIADDFSKYNLLIVVAEAMYRAGQKEQAHAVLTRASNIVISAKNDPVIGTQDVFYVVEAQADLDDIQGALRTMAVIDDPQSRSLRGIEGPQSRALRGILVKDIDSSYSRQAEEAIKRKDFEAARRLVGMIQGSTSLGSLYVDLWRKQSISNDDVFRQVCDAAAHHNAYTIALNTLDPAAKEAAMEAYVKQYPTAYELPSLNAQVSQVSPQKALLQLRVDRWSDFVEVYLKEPLFFDISGYVQSISAKPTSDDIFKGLTDTIGEYSRTLRWIQTFDPYKRDNDSLKWFRYGKVSECDKK